jgi:peptide subunit release factor 1 (eRF1)
MTTIDDLLVAEGPIASVYLRAPSSTFEAGYRLETGWKNARRRLADAEASDEMLDRLDELVASIAHEDAPAFALFSDERGGRTIVEPLEDAIEQDLAVLDRLPRLVPLLHTLQRSVPHVMVVTDRTGADIVAVVDGEAADADSVDGHDHHIHRGRFGGWSHRRIQQRAENRWEDNARDVSERVGEIARRVDARIVTIAGDVRARQFAFEHLDHDVRQITTLLDVGEADAIAEATVKLVADVVARDTVTVLDAHANRVGAGTAVAGPDAVLDALTAGRVETLLVVDDVDDDRRAFFSQDGSPVCSTTSSFDDMAEGRLVDVAVRSALLGDAAVRVVPATVLDGDIGALLRW